MRKQILLALGLLVASIGSSRGQDPAALPAPAESGSVSLMASPTSGSSFQFAAPDNNGWLAADFLFGWIEGSHLPPLVTTNPPGTAQTVAGVLGNPSTSVLLGGTVNHDLYSGFRLGGGYLYNKESGLGVEAGILYLPSQSSSISFTSDTNSILGRPFFDATTIDPDTNPTGDSKAMLVAFPGKFTGTINVHAKTGNFFTANFNLTERIWGSDDSGFRVDGLLGYRVATFNDGLRISQHAVSVDPLSPILPGTSIDSFDDFSARNTFNGADFGFRTSYSWNERLSVELLTKVAAGNMQRTVNIRGQNTTTVPGAPAPVTATGGLYALSSNIGKYSSNVGAVLPEGGANLNWRLRSNMKLKVGYSLLYLGRVQRADDQIDLTVNPDLFPPVVPAATPRRPVFADQTSNIWIQTLNVGVDVTF